MYTVFIYVHIYNIHIYIYTYCIFWLYNMFLYIYICGWFTSISTFHTSGFKSLQTLTGRLIGYIYIGYLFVFSQIFLNITHVIV